ncbi:MAG: hypothetical protein ACJ747_10110 [Gaiellaceae bacterium]
MRRVALSLAVPVAVLGLSGCIGPDGRKAEMLLQQAQQAQAAVTSERFVMRFDIDVQGHQVSMAMDGGAYLKGPHRGDFYATMTGSGVPQLQNLTTTLVKRGAVAAIRANGQTRRVAVPTAEQQFGSPVQMLDLERYVTSVSVDSSVYDGRPADRIVGKLDTQALLGSAGLASKVLEQSGAHFGDIRAVLYVPRDTHRAEVMFADLDIKADGQTAHMHVSLATRDVDKPLEIPQL